MDPLWFNTPPQWSLPGDILASRFTTLYVGHSRVIFTLYIIQSLVDTWQNDVLY